MTQEWPTPLAPKPIFIIGAGGIVSDAHLPAYASAGLPIAGITDLDITRANELASRWNVPQVHASAAAAANAYGTDVIYDVAVPPGVILDVLDALPDAAAVLIQKPMGRNLVEARSIRDLCRRKALKAAVNFQLRFSPMMMAARELIASDSFGTVLELIVDINIHTPWELFPFLRSFDRVEVAVHSIHYLDAIRSLIGNPSGVFARSLPDPRIPEFAQTRTSILLDYDTPVRCLLSIHHNELTGRKFQSAWIRISGTKATAMIKLGVLYDYPRGEPDELWYCEIGSTWQQIRLVGGWFVDAFKGPMNNLQRFVTGEDDMLFSGTEDAFHTMALAEACFDSMATPSVSVPTN